MACYTKRPVGQRSVGEEIARIREIMQYDDSTVPPMRWFSVKPQYTTATTATTSLRFSMHDRNEIFIPNLEGCLADAARHTTEQGPGYLSISTDRTGNTTATITSTSHTSEFDFSGPVYKYRHIGDNTFELAQDEPAKEKNMKALYEFYAVNRRTLVHLLKMVVASADEDEALSQILLEHAEEIKLNVGKPSECVFDLVRVFSFEPIEDKAD